MRLKFSRRTTIYSGAAFATCLTIGLGLYLLTQSLLNNVITVQLRQAGYTQAKVDHVRLYLDGIVIGHIRLDETTELHDLYTPQSAPSLAKNGMQQLIIKSWTQKIAGFNGLTLRWPFPHIERISIEDMRLQLDLPLQPITLSGTVKSLQPDKGQLALLMPFALDDESYQLNGDIEIDLAQGKIQTIDINLEDGFFQRPDMALRRLNGWMNIQPAESGQIQGEAQFTAGAVHYNGYDFADGMAQYSHPAGTEGQWTVTLNRPAQNYFNTWVIKPTTTKDRYAMQIAAQKGDETKTRTLVTAAPLRLDLLLVPQE